MRRRDLDEEDRSGKTREPQSQGENDGEKKEQVNKASCGSVWQSKQWEQNDGLNNEQKS